MRDDRMGMFGKLTFVGRVEDGDMDVEYGLDTGYGIWNMDGIWNKDGNWDLGIWRYEIWDGISGGITFES